MPLFKYKVRDQTGKALHGLIEAKDEKVASVVLREKGFFIIDINSPSQFSVAQFQRLFSKVSQGDVTTMTRQFATLITSGLPIIEALGLLHDQVQNPALADILTKIKHDVEGGSTLFAAFEKYPGAFGNLYLSLLKTGEVSGMLDKVLTKLADNMEKQREFNSKIKGALVYPVIVVLGMLVVAFVMMIFVIPKLTALYTDMTVDLPLPTKILISISDFAVKYWWLVIALIFGLFSAYTSFRKTQYGREVTDGIKLKVPVFGNLSEKVMLAEICRTLGLLVGVGIPIIEGLNIVKNASGNILYEQGLAYAAKHVEKGFPLGASLEQKKVFPPIIPQMIRIGEETGKLDDSLIKLSYYFESESEQLMKGLTTALEPIIMIVLGVGVGFLVISIIMPIYKITSAI